MIDSVLYLRQALALHSGTTASDALKTSYSALTKQDWKVLEELSSVLKKLSVLSDYFRLDAAVTVLWGAVECYPESPRSVFRCHIADVKVLGFGHFLLKPRRCNVQDPSVAIVPVQLQKCSNIFQS